MPLFNSSTPLPLTLEERAAQAAATTEAALVVFANAATDLDTAAEELLQLAEEHAEAASEHTDAGVLAQEAALRNRVRASKIRETFTF